MPEVLDQAPETAEAEEQPAWQYDGSFPDYRDLPEELTNWMKASAEKFHGEERFARWNEVRDCAKQHFYERTQQHIFWSNKDGYLMAGNSSTNSGVTSGGGSCSEEVDAPRFMRDFNIFTPCGRALFAALTENFPGVRFEPNKSNDPLDISAAKAKNIYRKQFERDADIRKIQRQVCWLALTDGKIGVEVFADKSDANYGVDTPESIEKCRVRGQLNWKTPILTQDPKMWPYAICSEDLPTVYLKYKHDWIKEKIQVTPGATLGEHPWTRISRLTVQQGTYTKISSSDAINNLTTRHEVWLAPMNYVDAPEEYQEFLNTEFSNGFKATFCGDVYAKTEKASHLKRVSWYHPLDGDGQATPSLLLVLLAPQDIFNDFMNLVTELVEECLPRMHFDAALIDPDARREQRSEPGAGGPVINPQPGSPLTNYFFREDGGDVPESLIVIIQWVSGQLCQMLSGASASLLGAANPEMGDTATAYEMSADKSLGVLGGPWGNLQTLFCEVESQAADLALETRGDSKIQIKGDGPGQMVQSVDIADFKGNTKSFPEKDSSFPTTYKQKLQQFFNLLTAAATSPAAAQMVTQLIQVPANQDEIQDLLALDEFVWPNADVREKTLNDIQQLLGSAPVPNQAVAQQYQLAAGVAQMAGRPAPPPPDDLFTSSLQPGKHDNYAVQYETLIEFINSPEGQEIKKQFAEAPPEQNNWLNLELYADANKAAMGTPPPELPKESISTSFKDLPPTAQQQYLKKYGIEVGAEELTDNKLMESKAVIDKIVGGKEQLPGEESGPPKDIKDKK